jgi:hypothetical protein
MSLWLICEPGGLFLNSKFSWQSGTINHQILLVNLTPNLSPYPAAAGERGRREV